MCEFILGASVCRSVYAWSSKQCSVTSFVLGNFPNDGGEMGV